MKFSMALRLALKNIKANKVFLIPFYISVSLMGMLFFIVFSFSTNKFVLTRHKNIIIFIHLATIIAGIFYLVICFYSNRVISKTRNKEFSLYGVLGLEKKHIAKIIFIEYLINFLTTTFFSLFGGYVFGKLAFIGLNYLLQNEIPNMNYSTSVFVEIISIVFFFGVFVLMYLKSIVKIGISTPIELMSSAKKSEKEPKVKWILFLLGSIALSFGYYLALKNNTMRSSFPNFFIAVLFVIIGTYFLFISLSILVLKILKRNKKYFYKPQNFISISGMLYRMKSNAVGLASVAILCTSIILTITVTTTIHLSINNTIKSISPRDYTFEYYFLEKNKNINENEIENEVKRLVDYVNKKSDAKNLFTEISSVEVVKINNGELKPYFYSEKDDDYVFMYFQPLKNYNEISEKKYSAKDGEILISSNINDGKKIEKLKVNGKEYKVKYIDENIVPSNIIYNAYKILTPDTNTFLEITKYFEEVKDTSSVRNASIKVFWDDRNFDIDSIKKDIDELHSIYSEDVTKNMILEVDGGFLYFGIMIFIIFLITTILITYYKQISEGLEDRNNYQTMKKVGISQKLTKKSIQRQIIWMFFLPLLVAVIHCLCASRILLMFISNFERLSIYSYLTNLSVVISIFVVIYFIIFKITSRVYYKIVS